MKLIIKTRRFGHQTVFFDKKDLPLIRKHKWTIRSDRGRLYCRTYIKKKGIFVQKQMHRLIMGVADSDKPHIDHKNDNSLDNRRRNIRFATMSQNTTNRGLSKSNTTGYKGVYEYKGRKANTAKYTATLAKNGKKIFGGYFKTAIEAAEKYNEMAIIYHGEFAQINSINISQLKKAKQLSTIPFQVIRKNNTGYYGVSKQSNSTYRNKPFVAKLGKMFLGTFKTAELAAFAYDKKAKEIYGDLAILNFNND